MPVNVIVIIGSERLFSDVSRRFSQQTMGEDAVNVVKISKSGGCVDRDDGYMRALRHAAIRGYFFGGIGTTLSPHTQMIDSTTLQALRVQEGE